MVSLKRTIAAVIVCFKPHVFLTLCIILVIGHSVLVAFQRGTIKSMRQGASLSSKQFDPTLAMTSIVLLVALIWVSFFIFVVRFELRSELENMLVLFQCSKRGLRFMGVVAFHLALLATVGLLVSSVVKRSISLQQQSELGNEWRIGSRRGRFMVARPLLRVTQQHHAHRQPPVAGESNISPPPDDGDDAAMYLQLEEKLELTLDKEDATNKTVINTKDQTNRQTARDNQNNPIDDKSYLARVYTIWLTAIVYSFVYLIIENMIMFYADTSLVEYVHGVFLKLVAKLTGIDLSDLPAGEMLYNPLIRRRIM